jgi:hypothetical protein
MRIVERPGETPLLRSLTAFIADLGVTKTTAWRWRKRGWLKVTNIAGKLYVSAEDDAEFNRRAKAGEFAQEAKTPKRKETHEVAA